MRYLLTILCIAATLLTAAQAQSGFQQGVVRTPEKSNQPSKGIDGATIKILSYPNTVVSKNGGKFSVTIPGKKPGDPVKVLSVQKKDFSIAGYTIHNRTFTYSSSVPIEIVMQSNKQLAKDKKKIEDKGFAKAKKRYESRIAELERQYQEKIINERQLDELCDQASTEYEQYISLLGKMAERYALTAHQKALEICESVLGSQDLKVAYLYYTVGHLYYDNGNNKKAIEYLSKAHDIYLAINGAEHNDTQTVQELIEHIKKRGNNH